jgi:hypothetical protein
MAKRTPKQSISFLLKRLDRAEKKLTDIANIIATTKETTKTFWNSLSRQSREAYEEARIVYADWNKSEIPYFYRENIRKQIKRIKALKFEPTNNVKYTTFINKRVNKRTVKDILEDSLTSFLDGTVRGEKKLNRLMGLTQQLNIAEKKLNITIAEGLAEKGTVRGAKLKLRNELLKDALDKEFITIINKNGKPINYKIDTYAEMVARTKITQAQSDGTVNLAKAYDSDLVQVSSHNTETAFDAQFEGKVFSLSGKDKDFPKAGFLPPFHPNCIHTLSIYFKEAHSNSENKAISDFSLNKTEIHPTRKSQIPISQRFKKAA